MQCTNRKVMDSVNHKWKTSEKRRQTLSIAPWWLVEYIDISKLWHFYCISECFRHFAVVNVWDQLTITSNREYSATTLPGDRKMWVWNIVILHLHLINRSDHDAKPVTIKLIIFYEWAILKGRFLYQINLNLSVPSSLTTGKAETLLSTKITRASWTDADSWTVAICLKVPMATSPICLWRNLGLGIIDPWQVCEGKQSWNQKQQFLSQAWTMFGGLRRCGGTWGCVYEWGCGGRPPRLGQWSAADGSYSSTRSRWHQTNWEEKTRDWTWSSENQISKVIGSAFFIKDRHYFDEIESKMIFLKANFTCIQEWCWSVY